MRVAILLLLFLGLAFYFNQKKSSEFEIQLSSSSFTKSVDDLTGDFMMKERLNGRFMVFGGHVDRNLPNSFSDYSMALLPMLDASRISEKYPDFYSCKSPGASLAQNLTGTFSLIMRDVDVADKVLDALASHQDSLESGGDRVCIDLLGYKAKLVSVILNDTGQDISPDVVPTLSNQNFNLIEYAELVDCRTFL